MVGSNTAKSSNKFSSDFRFTTVQILMKLGHVGHLGVGIRILVKKGLTPLPPPPPWGLRGGQILEVLNLITTSPLKLVRF